MKVAYIYAASWEFAYPQYRDDIDRRVWCDSDDFIFKYPRAMLGQGVEPTLFYFSETGRTVKEFRHKYGFRLVRLPVELNAGRFGREVSLTLLKILDREPYDLYHFYSYYLNRRWPDYFDFFSAYCRCRSRPYVCHFQGGEFPAGSSGGWRRKALEVRRRIKRDALMNAERVLSCSPLEIARLTDPAHPGFYGYPFDRARCVFVPNIVDLDLFHPMPRGEACARANLDPRHRYLLYVGFFREAKGVQDLIHAWAGIRAFYPGLKLLLVGSGEYEEALRALVKELGLDAHVVFAGPVPNLELCPWYNAAEVQVLPSYGEGLPSVVLEAIACGTPSVGTRVGGIPDVLGGGAGIVVEPHDVTGLALALREVLDGRFRLNPARRDRILAEYSYDRVGRLLRGVYGDICA